MQKVKKNKKQISVIIPTMGLRERLEPCLKSLRMQSFSSFEVIICLNGTTSLDLELQENEKLKVIEEKGVNCARNLGARHAEGEFLYFMDDDCRLEKADFLQEAYNYLIEESDCFGFGGPYKFPKGATVADRIYQKISSQWIQQNLYKKQKALYLLGGNFFVKSSIFKLGCQFDERIVWGGSELSFFQEIFLRQKKLEWKEEYAVLHEPKLSMKDLYHKLKKQGVETKSMQAKGQFLREARPESLPLQGQQEKLGFWVLQSALMPSRALTEILFAPFRILSIRKLRQLDQMLKKKYYYFLAMSEK